MRTSSKKYTRKLPKKYIPKYLSSKDAKLQASMIQRTHKAYKQGKYLKRKPVKTAKVQGSKWVRRAKRIYGLDSLVDSRGEKRFKTLSKKTGCSMKALNQIYAKGSAAWFSGSRPNQTQDSWAVARVASAVSGGKSASVDWHIIKDGCKPTGKAYKLALQSRKKHGYGTRRSPKRIIRYSS